MKTSPIAVNNDTEPIKRIVPTATVSAKKRKTPIVGDNTSPTTTTKSNRRQLSSKGIFVSSNI